ncbi:hypothetical protein ACFVZC_20870 [Streptomyces marokkonensis]|uniref:Rhodanese domain-containing protein n=1 Tax=Streptomyces marokkonensis TaxID=324855 RepID=A0ABW6Q9E1_9ACTN
MRPHSPVPEILEDAVGFADDHLMPVVDEGPGNSATQFDRLLPPRPSSPPTSPPAAGAACGHGERAMTGAGLMERAGHTDIAVLDGGPDDYATTHGQRLAQGAEDSRS